MTEKQRLKAARADLRLVLGSISRSLSKLQRLAERIEVVLIEWDQ